MRRRSTDIAGSQVPLSYVECPAKTFLAEDGSVTVGRNVFNHCQIVGEVARELIEHWRSLIDVPLFPEGSALVAACHDIGKVSPTFVEKLYRAANRAPHSHPALKNVDPELERQWGGHAGVSEVSAKAMGAPRGAPEVLGQHHGYSPPVADKRATDERFGGVSWQREREALVAALKQALGCDWPTAITPTQARILAGLTSVADWIGSGEFFEDPSADWQPRVRQAVDAAGFFPVRVRPDLTFQDMFRFPPNAVQSRFAQAVERPGVYVLEAPMGLGKTEAALYIAYLQLLRGQAKGIYFALPTQLTSNRIYQRFNAFLDAVLTSDTNHRALLLHRHAWLIDTEMGEEGRPGGAWFSQSKRGLLAPFAVGTLDQALMAVMNVKHGFVRAFGLAGKVVILDEVHTYDAYTGTLLEALIAFLREAGCTVIILTATLAGERRGALLQTDEHTDAYPLISAQPVDSETAEIALPAPASREIGLVLAGADGIALDEALCRAETGQQVLWIENTVGEAQESYRILAARAAEAGIPVGLLHSRYTPEHRSAREEEWVALFGKQGWQARSASGRLLVGTQVLEQSLDIDADFLVSRFCPTDMLLQRLGRLWRHEDTPRVSGSNREAWVLAPDVGAAVGSPKDAFGTTASVYSPYILCRSLEIWTACTQVTLPDDIRPMIDATYQARAESGAMARWRQELEEGNRHRTGIRSLVRHARGALSDSGKTLPEHKAGTRYSDFEGVDVLLLREFGAESSQRITRLVLLDGDTLHLPWGRHSLSRAKWRELSATLTRQLVRVPIYQAPEATTLATLRQYGLHHCFYLGDPAENEPLIRVALVDQPGRLRALDGGRVHSTYLLAYREDLGFFASRERS